METFFHPEGFYPNRDSSLTLNWGELLENSAWTWMEDLLLHQKRIIIVTICKGNNSNHSSHFLAIQNNVFKSDKLKAEPERSIKRKP